MKNKTYKKLNDPCHGWLAVPVKDILETKIEKLVSPFSYMSKSGKVVYLEEDCDMSIFLRAAEKLGWNVEICNNDKASNRRIRRLQNYIYA